MPERCVGSSEMMSEQMPVQSPPPSHQVQGHQTALHRAAAVGNSATMAALIQGGCAVDLQDRDGNTALHEASWHGFSHCVRLLVKAGADVHIRNKAGNTALHLACQNAHAQTARHLLLGGSTPDTRNNVGDTCLHVAARYDNLTLVKLLLSSMCSVTERNEAGDTALHVAAALSHKKTVQLLLEAGADGNIRNTAGKTALDRARDNNHKDVAHLLARAPQVRRFMRGRTIKKRRERRTAELRTQAVTGLLPIKDSSSEVEETPSSEQKESRRVIKVRHHQQEKQDYQNNSISRRERVDQEVSSTFDKNDLRRGENDCHVRKNLLCDDEVSLQNGKTYQLYTLYRDKDGNIRQAPADGCRCKPLLKKLEGQLKATQEEMRVHLLDVQEQVNSRLGKMNHRTRRQIKLLDMLNQERSAVERKNMVYRIEQRAAQGREEALMTQAAASHDLKRWCVSQLKDMDVHVPAKAQYYKLLPSQSVDDADLESLPLLSVVSGDSSTSLATYVNILPSRSAVSLGGQEQVVSRKYFEMKVDRSPDDYENTALFPLPASHTSGLLLGSIDPLQQPPGVQDGPTAAVMPLWGGESFSSSSSQSSSSAQGPMQRQGQGKKHFGELMGGVGIHTEGTRTLEFFVDRPAEPTFTQERNSQHAMEVTQRFFETVSTQLELWYERKVVEVEQQTQLRAQQDKKQLLHQISRLEAELQRLRANEKAELQRTNENTELPRLRTNENTELQSTNENTELPRLRTNENAELQSNNENTELQSTNENAGSKLWMQEETEN